MNNDTSRRAFLQRAGLLGIASSAAPFAMGLAAMGEAAAQSATDYKALVCVFLFGGNDYANTLIPYDQASYDLYRSFRSNIAIDRSALDATVLNPTTPLPGGRQYAVAPGFSTLLPVYDAGKMTTLLNVGTLIQPTTKAQYNARSVPLPPKLFSHNDQQSFWQSSSAEGAISGWGGRIGDLFASGNGNSTFTCISVSGNAVYLSGKSAVQYQVTTAGSVPVNGIKSPLYGSAACSTALANLMTGARTNLFESEYARISKRSIDATDQITTSLAASPALATAFPAGNGLASQLKMVAQLIGARQNLGAKRQVFFVSIGGFDTHDSLLRDHPPLIANVGAAMRAFYDATVELGVVNQVTAFTASDFGRTLVSNTDGSDHGWGSMHFVVGGSVLGKSYVGAAPAIANNGADDVGQGRLLPNLGVDQMAATLGKWFGVSATDMGTVLPNLKNFSTQNLGFMAA